MGLQPLTAVDSAARSHQPTGGFRGVATPNKGSER